ncbi:hypothetical protein [Stutzerimonas stutzeri]|uniref:hypothetical protein n=1 Tax=Stutzerimonas stutzeri TaxID=316 RepID=UPI001C2DFC32|nr:hypothetical protein [Stutzerimonas stutzeri]
MTGKACGEFEQLFAKLLEQKIRQGAQRDTALVKESYDSASSALSLLETKADPLHINDIAATLAGRENELMTLGSQRAQRLIFDLVYMH